LDRSMPIEASLSLNSVGPDDMLVLNIMIEHIPIQRTLVTEGVVKAGTGKPSKC